jgi:hypothetical protein
MPQLGQIVSRQSGQLTLIPKHHGASRLAREINRGMTLGCWTNRRGRYGYFCEAR